MKGEGHAAEDLVVSGRCSSSDDRCGIGVVAGVGNGIKGTL